MLRCEACGASLARRPAGERQRAKCAQCRGQPQVKPAPKLPPKQLKEQPMRGQHYDKSWLADQLAPPKLPWQS
jgi:hypothetical protein